MLSRCRGAKLHASALMLAFGGMRGIPRSEAQRGCRGARVRVRSWSRHGRVGWWCRSVRVRSACTWPASGMVACRVSRTIGCGTRKRAAASAAGAARAVSGKRAGRAKKGPCGSGQLWSYTCYVEYPTARIGFGSRDINNPRLDRTKWTLFSFAPTSTRPAGAPPSSQLTSPSSPFHWPQRQPTRVTAPAARPTS